MRDRIQSGGLEITEQCNLKCIHCYKGDIETPLQMNYKHISYFIEQFIKYGANEIVITGGEPFCHPDINKIIEDIDIKYSDIGFVITTNGTLLSEEVICSLKSIKNLRIQISLDGANLDSHEMQHGKNTFDQIINKLELLSELPRNRKVIRMAISKINYKECLKVATIAKKFNTEVHFTYVSKIGRAEKNWAILKLSLAQQIFVNEIINEYKRENPDELVIAPHSVQSCPFEDPNYIFGLSINPKGEVSVCTCLDSAYTIGNAYEDDFLDIINSPQIDILCQKINERKTQLKNTFCKECSANIRCRQGCIGRSNMQNPHNYELDDQCEFRRALQFKNLYFLLRKRDK